MYDVLSPIPFKLSFSVYGFEVIEAYSKLVRHFFGPQILFPLMILESWSEPHVSDQMSWPFGWMPFGLVTQVVPLLVGQHK